MQPSFFVRSALTLLVPAAVVLSSCTGAGGPSNSTAVLAVKVTPANPTVEGGAPLVFVATAILQNGENRDVTADPGTSWTSSDTTVVEVNADGTGNAVNAGQAYVSAEVDGVRSPSQLVTVTAPATPTPTPTPAPTATNVVISEVRFNEVGASAATEFVELHNPTAASVTVDGWTLSVDGGATLAYTVPAATSIAADGFLVICNGACGIGGALSGFSQSLPNSGGEWIVLKNAATTVIDEMAYGTGGVGKPAGWCTTNNPSATADDGNSVSRKPISSDGNNCNDWVSNTPANPGAATP